MKNLDALAAYRPLVKAGLESFVKQRRQPINGLAWNDDVMKRLSDFAISGKLLRGSLVCYSYAICSGTAAKTKSRSETPPGAVLKTAMALELVHAALLIHDDIIDQDDRRRGQPAIHRQYGQLAASHNLAEAARAGESLALCAGDMTLFLAFELLAAAQAGTGGDTTLSELFVRELTVVCAGQMQDVYLGAWPGQPAKRDIYAVMRAKTAAYSVALPLAAGAVLAGQTAAARRQLHAIGMAAGTMFQIRDDELGSLGQAARLGKPVGSDIREGKKTLLYYYLRQAAGKAERQKLAAIFGNPEASAADISYVRQALRRHHIPVRLRQDIGRLEQTAFRGIDRLKLAEQAKTDLRRLVRLCAARQF